MKTVNLILLLTAAIVLYSCGTTKLEEYPNFIKQKDNINNIVILTDFAIDKEELGGVEPFSRKETEKLRNVVNEDIKYQLSKRGYRFTEFFEVAPEYPYWINPVRMRFDTLNKNIYALSKEDKYKYPYYVIKEYVFLEERLEDEFYSIVLPNKINTAEKILITNETIEKENISAAVLFFLRGVSVSTGKKVAESIVSGLVSGLISAAMGSDEVHIEHSISWAELQLLIVDRENNDILWQDVVVLEGIDPIEEYKDILHELKLMFNKLPNKWDM